jgi:hypothetical protein
MKRIIFIALLLYVFPFWSFADSYSCINKKAAESVVIANLGQGFHNASTNEQQDLDEMIFYYAQGLKRIDGGYVSLPNSYFKMLIKVSCLGIFEENWN